MQIGSEPSPSAVYCAIFCSAVGIEEDVGGAVDPRGDRRRSCRRSSPRRGRGARTTTARRRRSTTACARSAAPAPPLVKPSLTSAANAPCSVASERDELDLRVGVARPAVDRHHAGQPELARRSRGGGACSASRSSIAAEPGVALARVVSIAAVVLERAHGHDEHDAARRQAADAADDVHELLHAHVRAEARLGHHVVAELEPDQVGDQRRVAVGDVRERARVHQAGLALERLDQVGLDRLLEQHGHRARGAEVLGGDRLAAVEGARDGDRPEAPAQVVQVARRPRGSP